MSITAEQVFHGADQTLALLRSELASRWPAGSDRVTEMTRYALLPPGKLFRPLLLMESAAAVGGDQTKVTPAALGVEYLHVGSLVHDDVIDNDEMRRGRPSVMARFGIADAIVTGDGLLMAMFAALAECAERGVTCEAVTAAIQVLASTGIELCRGQVLEAQLRGRLDDGMQSYLTMISLKTGALFRGVCRSGAILGGGSLAQQDALERYADHFGRAFQMYDDLLPYVTDSVVTGKPCDSDAANQRPTLPVLVGYEQADSAQRARFRHALSGQLTGAEAHQAIKRLLDETRAIALSQELIAAQLELAKRSLAALPPTRSTEILGALAELSVNRPR